MQYSGFWHLSRESSASELASAKLLHVITHHLLDALADGPAWLPLELLLRPCGVGPSSLRVIDGYLLVDDLDPLGK